MNRSSPAKARKKIKKVVKPTKAVADRAAAICGAALAQDGST